MLFKFAKLGIWLVWILAYASMTVLCAIIPLVKIQHLTCQQNRANWLKKPIHAAQYQSWLVHKGSLTARLKARYLDFTVQPQRVAYAKVFFDEQKSISLQAHQYALIREVILMGDHQPLVFAHSVLPRESLRGAWRGLGKLGNKPLGAALFSNPKVKRTPLEYKKLPRQHPISMRVAEHLKKRPNALWARRSIFSLNCARILVTEVFLNELLK